MKNTAVTRDAIVLIPACSNVIGSHPAHTVQRKYADAVFYGAQCTPLMFPAMGGELDIEVLLNAADGVFLSGSPSNVDAKLYGEAITQPHLPQDPLRDDVTIPLIRAAVARGMPIFGVCRGFQEINVAFGGTLSQAVHELDAFDDHREDKYANLDAQYAPAHAVHLVADGLLGDLLNKSEVMVNSLHGQGIQSLGHGLTVEANAPDGLVEAFSIAGHPNFGLAVQWHPEWRVMDLPDSLAIFEAFGRACQLYALNKRSQYAQTQLVAN